MTTERQACGRMMVGSGSDTYDPLCDLPAGHEGVCRSTAAIDQHRLTLQEKREAWRAAESEPHDPFAEVAERLKDMADEIDAMALRATLPAGRDRWTTVEVRHATVSDSPDGWDVTVKKGGL